jgi:hypothetical protein
MWWQHFWCIVCFPFNRLMSASKWLGMFYKRQALHIWDGNASWSCLDRCVLLCVLWIDILMICPPLLTSQYICLCKSLGSHNSFHQMAWHDPFYISLSYKWVSLVLGIVCGLVQRNVTDCCTQEAWGCNPQLCVHLIVADWCVFGNSVWGWKRGRKVIWALCMGFNGVTLEQGSVQFWCAT